MSNFCPIVFVDQFQKIGIIQLDMTDFIIWDADFKVITRNPIEQLLFDDSNEVFCLNSIIFTSKCNQMIIQLAEQHLQNLTFECSSGCYEQQLSLTNTQVSLADMKIAVPYSKFKIIENSTAFELYFNQKFAGIFTFKDFESAELFKLAVLFGKFLHEQSTIEQAVDLQSRYQEQIMLKTQKLGEFCLSRQNEQESQLVQESDLSKDISIYKERLPGVPTIPQAKDSIRNADVKQLVSNDAEQQTEYADFEITAVESAEGKEQPVGEDRITENDGRLERNPILEATSGLEEVISRLETDHLTTNGFSELKSTYESLLPENTLCENTELQEKKPISSNNEPQISAKSQEDINILLEQLQKQPKINHKPLLHGSTIKISSRYDGLFASRNNYAIQQRETQSQATTLEQESGLEKTMINNSSKCSNSALSPLQRAKQFVEEVASQKLENEPDDIEFDKFEGHNSTVKQKGIKQQLKISDSSFSDEKITVKVDRLEPILRSKNELFALFDMQQQQIEKFDETQFYKYLNRYYVGIDQQNVPIQFELKAFSDVLLEVLNGRLEIVQYTIKRITKVRILGPNEVIKIVISSDASQVLLLQRQIAENLIRAFRLFVQSGDQQNLRSVQ